MRTWRRRRAWKLTPDELARRAATQRMVRERIAHHEAKAREQEDAAARKRSA